MSAVSETIVREFFEVQGFLVKQQRKHVGREEDEIDFLVYNPRPQPGGALPFDLAAGDVSRITRAVVAVRGWHTETFGPGLLANAPEVFRFVEPDALRDAQRSFGDTPELARILVIPALTTSREAREQTIASLRARGVDAVISFRVLLAALIDHVEVNRNYAKSDLLQTLRILKNYELFREPQMDLFRKTRPAARERKPKAGAKRPDLGAGTQVAGEVREAPPAPEAGEPTPSDEGTLPGVTP